MYVRSSGLPPIAAWYVSKLRTRSAYDASSGLVPRPARNNRCRKRASSSFGWNGDRQKSSKRSSRCSSSCSCAPETSSRIDSTRRVALAQRAAQRERAFGIVVGAHDRARPAVGRLAPASRPPRSATAFHALAGEVERPREQRRRRIGKDEDEVAEFGHGRVARLQRSELAIDLERRDVGLVLGPLPTLVTRKYSNTCSPSASAISSERSIASSASRSEPGSDVDALGEPLGVGERVDVVGRLGRQRRSPLRCP